jgi:hypothetical protein
MAGARKFSAIKEMAQWHAAEGCHQSRTLGIRDTASREERVVANYWRRVSRLFKACRDSPSMPAARP